MPSREAIRGQTPDWGSRSDEHPAAVLGDHQALGPELLYCLADRHSGDAKVVDQDSLRRKTFPGGQLSGANRSAQQVSDLSVGRFVVRAVDLAEFQHLRKPSIRPLVN